MASNKLQIHLRNAVYINRSGLTTIAMIQSLEKLGESEENEKYLKTFGTIIIDECHHVPAETFRNTLSKFHAFYIYGLTATPFRKYNDGKLIFIYLGEIISEIKPQDVSELPVAKVIVRNSDLFMPFNFKTDKFETLSKVLIHDSTRNKLIIEDVIAELDKGKKAVLVTERKQHIDTLFQYLKQKYEAITEVENVEIRPEFDILKPYFTKILKTKFVKVDVLARFVRGVLVNHSAASSDL